MGKEKKVNICGFRLTLNKHVSWQMLLSNLKDKCDTLIDNGSTEQIIYLSEKNKYIIGSALAYKGYKKMMATKRDEKGNLIVELNEISAESSGIEPTLFAFHPKTLCGVYCMNYGSPSLNSIKRIFKGPHDEILKKIVDTAIHDECLKKKIDENEKAKREKVRKDISGKYKGDLHIEILTDPFDLEKLLEKFKKINRCEITATTALENSPLFTPLNNLVKEANVNFSFDRKKNSIVLLKDAIIAAFGEVCGSEKYKTLRLIGKGFSGEELREIVGEVKHYYHSYTYDEFIAKLPSGKWIDYTTCPVIDKLVEIISDNKAIFGENP